jgi:hypothetical protein
MASTPLLLFFHIKEAYWRALSFWQHKCMVLPRFQSSPTTNGCDFGVKKEKKKNKKKKKLASTKVLFGVRQAMMV